MRFVSKSILAFALAALAAAAWAVTLLKPYTPGSDVGYGLGLAGGLMMLALLTYPLRKHVKGLRRMGTMKPWFQAHMVLGILGPVLVVFHTAFTVSSFNALVALLCMVIVALERARRALRLPADPPRALRQQGKCRGVRGAHAQLGARARLARARDSRGRGCAHGVSRGGVLARRRHGRAHVAIPDAATSRAARGRFPGPRHRAVDPARGPVAGWDAPTQARRIRRGGALVRSYLRAVNAAAQFGAFERIFSLWHVMHIPLVYLLVLSAAYHVLAVHMY
ncbi:MAG: hypothetical protein IPH30_10695 [Betaproteobacteria bacterium]|nr:hypothetical protein [Betaproteobacteria bacterium]